MGIGVLEKFDRTRKPLPADMVRWIDRSSGGVMLPVGERNDSHELLPEERLLIMVIIHASKHHKFEAATEAVGRLQLEGFPNAPILYDNPEIFEERVNALQLLVPHPTKGYRDAMTADFSLRPDLIALAKATRSVGTDSRGNYRGDTALLEDIARYLYDLRRVNLLEENPSLRPAHPLNPHGRHVFSVAHDVVVYRKAGEILEPLHQQKHLGIKYQHLKHLYSFFGISEDGLQMQSPVNLLLRDGVAVHDLMSGVAGITRREATLQYVGMDYRFINAYVYGLSWFSNLDPLYTEINFVSALFTPEEKKRLFKGWTPEDGINPAENKVVNGAIVNQCPILWLGVPQVRALLLAGKKEEALLLMKDVIDIATGTPSHLPVLLRGMIQLLADPKETKTSLQDESSQSLRSISHAVWRLLRQQVVAEQVVDFTDKLSDINVDDRYLHETLPRLLAVRT